MDLTSLSPLPGGWSGETFLAEAAGERSVVRIYARPSHRGAAAHEVDAALLRLVRGLVPVPEVLEVRAPDEAVGLPALLVTSFVSGVNGDELLARLGADGRSRVGSRLGALLSELASMPMLRPGPFVDGELTIGSFGDLDGLPRFVEQYEEALRGFSPDDLVGLRAVAKEAQALLDTVRRFSLVHSDFNAKNLLLDPDTLEVTAVIDWEYAHSGHPYSDLGNLLRFERDEAFAGAVLAAYTSRRGGDAASALALARAADLWALVDLAAKAGDNPVADRAHAHLLAIARTRDLHALPENM